ncbi:MAG: hypothetical protein RI637_08445 [Acidimicrobiia bacterium]|nr:hypothetical protein [Acidimicrobiia bacterium]
MTMPPAPIGTDMATPPGTPVPDGQSTMAFTVLVGQPRTSASLLTPGTHLLDCKTVDHVWRSARIEVVAP